MLVNTVKCMNSKVQQPYNFWTKVIKGVPVFLKVP